MSYVIPAERLSLAAQERLRYQAETQARKRLAGKTNVSEAAALDKLNPAIIARDEDYINDFIPAATRAGLAGWLTMPLAAIAGMYSVFADNVPAAMTPQVPNNNTWVFYGVEIYLADWAAENVTYLQFGVGNANNRRAQFDLEKLYVGTSSAGYFSQPVCYDPQEVVNIQVRARLATAAGCRMRLMTFIAEPIQTNVI